MTTGETTNNGFTELSEGRYYRSRESHSNRKRKQAHGRVYETSCEK